MCEKREQGNIFHKVNKISRVVCGLFIKFACVHKAVAFVKCLNIRITACSKSLVNGQCGGSKNGKCEVDSEMECGWERIYRRLKEIGRLDVLKCPTQIHNFATDDDVK